MVKILAALLLLVCVVRVVGPATTSLQDVDILFSSSLPEEDNKAQEENAKSKAEQEIVFPELGFALSTSPRQLQKHPFESSQFIPTAFHEPLCPPPNTSHS